jgi:hypothetical protein
MASCEDFRKWFHVRFAIQNRSNGNDIYELTSVSNDLGDIANSDKIFVRYQDCSSLSAPPRAWDPDESPGWFYFRPTVADLEQAFVDVSSYEEVVDETNRRIFVYELIATIDSSDTIGGSTFCNATGPPDALCPDGNDIYDRIVDDRNSVVFRWPEIDVLTEIGCCRIELDDPGDPGDPPTDIRDCSRIWAIIKNGNDHELRYFDFEAPFSQALVVRGRIVNAAGIEGDPIWLDLAWDTRDFLWGLEKFGLRRILPGRASLAPDVSGIAQAQDYATFTGDANLLSQLTDLFTAGLDDGGILGKAAMSYNQTLESLFIAAGDKLFELKYVDETTWQVTKVSGTLAAGEDGLGDLAFDVFGNCYCVLDDDLAEIDFESPTGAGFGQLTPIGNGGLLRSMTGMDFILDLAGGEFISFYGAISAGQVYRIDRFTGEREILSGVNLGPNVVGISSCQAGEDLRAYEIPFFPGDTPWLFIIDGSGSMSRTNSCITRENLIRRDLPEYIDQYVEDGEIMAFVFFGGGFSRPFVTSDKEAAKRHITEEYRSAANNQPSGTYYCDPGGTDFCQPVCCGRTFTSVILEVNQEIINLSNGQEKLNACMFIGDGEFVDNVPCQGNALRSFMQNAMAAILPQVSPGFVVRTVGIQPTSGLQNLQIVAEEGGGDFESWVVEQDNPDDCCEDNIDDCT